MAFPNGERPATDDAVSEAQIVVSGQDRERSSRNLDHVQESNRLPVLAAEIRQADADVQTANKTAVQRAIDAGRSLIEAKGLLPHGAWLPFLAEAGIHERAAQRYITLAASNLESDFMSDLGGIGAALKFISERKKACAALDEAEAAARAGRDGLDEIEHAMNLIDNLVAMIPAEIVTREAAHG